MNKRNIIKSVLLVSVVVSLIAFICVCLVEGLNIITIVLAIIMIALSVLLFLAIREEKKLKQTGKKVYAKLVKDSMKLHPNFVRGFLLKADFTCYDSDKTYIFKGTCKTTLMNFEEIQKSTQTYFVPVVFDEKNPNNYIVYMKEMAVTG